MAGNLAAIPPSEQDRPESVTPLEQAELVGVEEDANDPKIQTQQHQEETAPWNDVFVPLTMDDYYDCLEKPNSNLGENHGDASFTGVWGSAKIWMDHLHGRALPERVRVLELGAGTGWLGITLLANHHNSGIQQMILTDTDRTGAVTWTQQNVNKALQEGLLPEKPNLQVLPLDWNNTVHMEAVVQQLVVDEKDGDDDDYTVWMVGSDLIYSEDGVQALADAVASLFRLLRQQLPNNHQRNITTQFLYGHTQGRMPELDQLWTTALQSNGLSCRIIHEQALWGDRTSQIMDIRMTL